MADAATPARASGPAVDAVDVAVPVDRLRALGFAPDDGGAVQVGATALRLVAPAAPGDAVLPGWTLRAAAGTVDVPRPDALDGIPTRWVDGPYVPVAAGVHPNSAVALDHVVVQTPDTGRTIAALEGVGMVLRRERTAGTGSRALRQAFFRHGEAIVELVGPLQTAGDGPATLWGLTVLVADLDGAVALLGDAAGTVRAAVQPGRRIVTVRGEATGGLPLALMDAAAR